MMPSIMSGSLIRDTPPWARMSAGTRSRAITATAPASSAILACSGVTTSMITPPLSISAIPRLTRAVPVTGAVLVVDCSDTAERLLKRDGKDRPNRTPGAVDRPTANYEVAALLPAACRAPLVTKPSLAATPRLRGRADSVQAPPRPAIPAQEASRLDDGWRGGRQLQRRVVDVEVGGP